MVRRASVLFAFLLVAVSCGTGGPARDAAVPSPAVPAPATPTPSTDRGTPAPGKPPVEAAALIEDYREPLRRIGLVMTDRGGLIDRSEGGYEKSPDGDHLALYLEPAGGERTMQEFVDGIVEATKVFVPEVFERWPGLASMDVCQEPRDPELQRLKDPPPVSQIEVSRAQAEAIDWQTVTVADLVAAAAAEPPRLRLIVSEELQRSDEYLRAAG